MEPANMVSSGAFRLKEWRPYERLVLERNPAYYDAGMVGLDEVQFFTLPQSSTIVDLYRAGEVHSMPGERIPVQFTPLLEGRRDFHVRTGGVRSMGKHEHQTCAMRRPSGAVRAQYGVGQAAFRQSAGLGATAGQRFCSADARLSKARRSVEVEIGGRSYNVLEHNPEAARGLLAASATVHVAPETAVPFGSRCRSVR